METRKRSRNVLVVSVPGLAPSHIESLPDGAFLKAFASREVLADVRQVFPALTLPVQAALTTGALPAATGVVSNGLYDRALRKVWFWEQSAHLNCAVPIWRRLRASDRAFTSALLFYQLAMGAGADYVLSPAPVHTESRLIESVYSRPPALYSEIAAEQGDFRLTSYWGPMAGPDSSRWIASATSRIIAAHRPNLVFAYLPQLDYTLQRGGDAAADVALLSELIETMAAEADALVVVSEYTMTPVRGAVFPNRCLRDWGYLRVREVEGKEYLLLADSEAIAVADHQIAHVYCEPTLAGDLKARFGRLDGIEQVLDRAEQREHGVDHPRSGELVLVAAADRWFAYYWWLDDAKAPHFARSVDIHAKPGYDPLELFWHDGVPLRTELVRASHGRAAGTVPALMSRDLMANGATLPTRQEEIASLLARYLAG